MTPVSENSWLPLAILAGPLVPVLTFFLKEKQHALRIGLNLGAALLELLFVAILLSGVAAGGKYEVRFAVVPGADIVLDADPLSLLFITLSATLWLLTTIYAIGYLEGSPHRSRFFGFFSLCVFATAGVAMSGNMLTLLLFYELLTLVTYPLVLHRGTAEAVAAGRTYLIYTLSGGTLILIGVVWLRTLAGPLDFTEGGLQAVGAVDSTTLRIVFAVFVAGFGVKAALVPLHGWLPKAMVAPAPVSALLHAVAVVKAGAFGLVRLIYDVYGIEFADSLGVLAPLAVLAAATVVWGSVRALQQDELKKRLAYSTVSQVSYIALGIAAFGPVATVGGLVHIAHQGVMKITLFFCAGNLAETLGIHHISEMRGVGRRMPLTMSAFTIGALGMIGVPPVAGFISKWYLGVGALASGAGWVVIILVVSTLLNAAYFLPILYSVWFQSAREPARHPVHHGDAVTRRGALETYWPLLLPPLVTASLALAAGLLAGASWSPLGWAELITAREYVR